MIEDKIKSNVALAPLTTFKIGGPAEFFVLVDNEAELKEALAWAKAKGKPYFILGGGSNLLVSDQGFTGLIIKLNNQEINFQNGSLLADAGARLSDLVAMSEVKALSGLEWAAGIPGSVGGAIRGNAGAFGLAMENSVSEVKFFDVEENNFKTWPADKLNFTYRHSLFKQDQTKIIWQASFSLTAGDQTEISQKIADIIDQRLKRQPNLPSAGCVFKNLSASKDSLKNFDPKDQIKGNKVACGLVVESLGLKGSKFGQAKISEEHANFIVNCGQATAKDVRGLIEQVRHEAEAKYDLKLEEEIQYLGLF